MNGFEKPRWYLYGETDAGQSWLDRETEVVRCRDCRCKHYVDGRHLCVRWQFATEPDGFCAWGEKEGRMSIEAKCDLCGIPISGTESMNVFRMWNGVRIVQIEDDGIQGVPYDENFFICDDCAEKVWELLGKYKAVGA